jgi:hypothetical protein|tara:strand:- start:755 stop:943 length:189 start_codon:yes stop_codon:yes gene_type:complete
VESEGGRAMSIGAMAPPVLKDEPEEDEDKMEIETVREASKVSRNILRPTNVYEDSPLLQFQK